MMQARGLDTRIRQFAEAWTGSWSTSTVTAFRGAISMPESYSPRAFGSRRRLLQGMS
jgi:hypothetical protein